MQRRSFLKFGLGTGAAAAALPGWSAALAGAGGEATREHLQRGRETGKPVLVLLVPGMPEQANRMQMWAELLAVADDATLAELALCEVVCARPDEAGAAAQAEDVAYPRPEIHDIAVLLETDGTPPQRISGRDLPAVGNAFRDGSGDDKYDASVRRRAAALAKRVRAAILPNDSALERRVAASRDSLDMGLQMQLVLDHYPRPRLAHLDRGAALVLAEARRENSKEKETNLARAALLRLWEEAPEGAQWTSSTGYCPPCGMGHVPDISRHFLSFFAE